MAAAAAGEEERRKTACVTGGNGYIASLLIKMLLEKGYAVNTTVRHPEDKESNSHLEDLKALGPLQVHRADLADEGSYDAAVAGCDVAFLLAAPVNYTSTDPEKELLELGVQGTLNVLRSCVKSGTVKRVVLTSSTAAVSSKPLDGDGQQVVLDEESWSDVDYLTAKRSGLWAYPASKVLLERAAAEFAAAHGVSLVTVCPSVTVGEAPDRQVYTTVPAILSLLSGDAAELAVLRGIERASRSVPLVHVEDVCRAEIFAAEVAADGRYICNSVDTTIVEMARFLADKYPQYDVSKNLSRGGDDDGLLEKPIALLPSTKLIKAGFEFKYKTLEHIYENMVEYGKALGILTN